MYQDDMRRLFLIGAILAVASLTAACESEAERQARLKREAYIKSIDVEELKNSLETVNPDPYARQSTGPGNIGRQKKH